MRPAQFEALLVDEFGFPKRGSEISWRTFKVQRLDLTSLHLSFGSSTPILMDDRSPERTLTNAEVRQFKEEVRQYLQEHSRRFCIVLTASKFPEDTKILGSMDVPEDFAIIEADEQEKIASLKDIALRHRAFGTALTRQVGVLKMSPYALEEPAEAGRFFGRTHILRKILAPMATRCFLLIGPRRIGKTSILLEAKRHLRTRQPDPSKLRVAHIIGSEFRSSEQVVAQIVSELEDRHPDKVSYKFETKIGKYRSLPEYVRRLTRGGRCKVAIFIDEVDKIIQFDEQQNFECLDLLRNMVMRGSESTPRSGQREKQRIQSSKSNSDHAG